MDTAPQEGGGVDTRSLINLTVESFSIEVTEWTDGQVNVALLIHTKSSRYRWPMPLSGFLQFTIEVNKCLVELLRNKKVGK